MDDQQLHTIRRLFIWCHEREAALADGRLDPEDAARSFLVETDDFSINVDHLARLIREFIVQLPPRAATTQVQSASVQPRFIVLSGIRATGRMHVGNYLGALERFAKLSRDPRCQCFFFVADLHALTTRTEAPLIRQHAYEIVLDMLGAGVEPDAATLYVQSHVPIVAELAWYLACVTPARSLERIPAYREGAGNSGADVSAGFLTYPVLMAADILGVRANLVPVGPDQKPHLDLVRDVARRFNRAYGEFFPIPDPMEEEMVFIGGLASPGRDGHFPKMGTSEAQTLYLNDPWESNHDKILRSPTDPARVHRRDRGSPEKCATYALHQVVSGTEDVRWSAEGCRTAGIACVECKDVLARNVANRLQAFHERRRSLAERPERLRDFLAEGARRTRRLVEETTAEVADKLGVFRAKHGPP